MVLLTNKTDKMITKMVMLWSTNKVIMVLLTVTTSNKGL